MKILILGGSGMLGHRLWMNLNQVHETWVTVRGSGTDIPEIEEFPRQYIYPYMEALDFDQIVRSLACIQPDIVINCIGLIKQMGEMAQDPLYNIELNALLPHKIAMMCRAAKIRMIHISTDCVFNGRKGNYLETDPSDAEDIYGRSKYLGEVSYPHCITLRTSFIGMELKNHFGLLDWFLNQNGRIKGYRRAIFTGFTTDEISRIILDYVIPKPSLNGVFHVSSEPISKYDLLRLIGQAFNKTIEILPDDEFFCDRSLDSTKFRQITNYQPPTWESMIQELVDSSELYKRLR